MTDTVNLRKAIDGKGIKYKYLALQLGLSPYGLQRKIENDAEFKISEVDKLSEILNFSIRQKDNIFFAK